MSRVARLDISEHFQGLEWAISNAIDSPNEHTADRNTRHLVRDLLSLELYLVDFCGEPSNWVKWASEASKTYTSLQHLSVAKKEHPFIWLTVYPERLNLIPNSHNTDLESFDDNDWDDDSVDQ